MNTWPLISPFHFAVRFQVLPSNDFSAILSEKHWSQQLAEKCRRRPVRRTFVQRWDDERNREEVPRQSGTRFRFHAACLWIPAIGTRVPRGIWCMIVAQALPNLSVDRFTEMIAEADDKLAQDAAFLRFQVA